ncbi:MAG: NUDIX hydrolase [Thermoplasmata archaeon]|nr:NUDIX hydrolase [Thermoplasmata archaeon]
MTGRSHTSTRGRPVTPALTVDAFFLSGRKLLLVRRRYPPFEERWALPGGFVELGESCETAVLRELHEETGTRGRIVRLLGVYSDPKRDPRGPSASVVYQVAGRRKAARGGDDAREARWWPFESLPPLAFDHEQIVADAKVTLRRRPSSRS